MIFEYQKAYDGSAVIVGPTNKLIYLRAGQAGILREFTVFLGGSLTGSVNKAIFNLRKNGVSLFSGTGRLVVQDSHTATLSGLNISLAKGDELQLDIEQTPNASRILNPVTLVLSIENDFPAWTAEQIQDLVAAMFVTGTRTSWIYDDAAGTLRVDATTMTDEEVQDKVAAFLTQGTNVTVNYNDGANTLTISSTDTTRTNEEIMDVVANLLQQGTNVTLTYNDGADTLTVSATGGGSAIAQQSLTVTTSSIATGITVDKLAALGKTYALRRISADKPCRVRGYLTDAQRTADLSRAVGTYPTGDHGIAFAFNLTSDLDLSFADIVGSNQESIRSANIPIYIENRSGSTGTVSVTFYFITLEA